MTTEQQQEAPTSNTRTFSGFVSVPVLPAPIERLVAGINGD